MPEGDAVRRTANRLHAALAGRELVRAEMRWPDLGGVDLAGRTVVEVDAYGKHLLLRIAGTSDPEPSPAVRAPSRPGRRVPTVADTALTWHTHLRMDGSFACYRTGSRRWPPVADQAVRAVLANAEWTAVGYWLGMMDLVPTGAEQALIGHLGPDLMAEEFPSVGLAQALERFARRPDRPIGAALMDQTNVAGIGTIYMSESLYATGTSPWRPAAESDLPAILAVARRQLLAAVTQPFPNTTGDMRKGQTHYVHARVGRPCRRCGTTVRVAPVGDPARERPAFYCPTCQPGRAPTDDGRPQSPLGSAPARPWSARNNGLTRRRGPSY
jgi:endonuclease-8